MYTRGVGKGRIVLVAYVDDLLSICSPKTMEKWRKEMDKARGSTLPIPVLVLFISFRCFPSTRQLPFRQNFAPAVLHSQRVDL